MVDPLVTPFGAAISRQLPASILARELFNASRSAAISAHRSGPVEEFESLELETKLWDLAVAAADSQANGNLPAEVVVNWAQRNLYEPMEPSKLQSIRWLNSKGRAEMDEDSPLRQGIPIANEDLECDDAFFRYIFELVLAGELERAQEVAQHTGNWLVKSVLSAFPNISSNRLLKEACNKLSVSAAGDCERAFYGLLSGNIEASSQLCSSWEQLLLVYMLAKRTYSEFEAKVQQLNWKPNWYRQIMLSVMNGTLLQLIDRLVGGGDVANGPIAENPWLSRVLLHLQLVLNQYETVHSTLVVFYVEQLCEDSALLASRLPLVPAYVHLLSSASQSTVYGRVLGQITDTNAQAEQIELAKKYGIALEPALKHAVELNFELFEENPDAVDSDSRLVGVLRWLVAAELWPAACSALLRAYALLLLNDHREGAMLLARTISAEMVRTGALDANTSLRSRLHELPNLASDLALLKQYDQLTVALGALRGPSVATTFGAADLMETVNASLGFGANSTDKDVVAVRSKYIPIVVYELLGMLRTVNGASGMALDVAVKIADERLKLYELFDASLLSELVGPTLASIA